MIAKKQGCKPCEQCGNTGIVGRFLDAPTPTLIDAVCSKCMGKNADLRLLIDVTKKRIAMLGFSPEQCEAIKALGNLTRFLSQ